MMRLLQVRGVRYVIIGLWNMVFGLALFTVLQQTVSDEIGYITTLIIAQVIAVIQAHATQRLLVWRSSARYVPELLRFSTIYAVVLILNIVLLSALVEGAGAPVLLSQYVVGGGLIAATYLAQRHWAFADTREPRLEAEHAAKPSDWIRVKPRDNTAQGDRP